MKTTILSIAITIMGTAALPTLFAKGTSSEQVARKIVVAFKKSSPQAYTALFPTLAEIHQVMDENAAVYGETLDAAKEEFSIRYENELLPALKESFERIMREGKEKGIVWNSISFVRVEYSKLPSNLSRTPLTIIFSSKGKEYRLEIEDAFILHDEWKVGQKMNLI